MCKREKMANRNSGQGPRKGRPYALSTGIPMLDMVQQQMKTLPSPTGSPVPRSTAVPVTATDSGARGRRRSPRGGSPKSSGSEKSSPNRGSPVITNALFYAGAKFSEAPSPASLPKPPSHWTISSSCREFALDRTLDQFQEATNHLKTLLKLEA